MAKLHRETLKALHVNLKPNGEIVPIVPVILIYKHVTVTKLIGHYRVASNLGFKARLKAPSICQLACRTIAGPVSEQMKSAFSKGFSLKNHLLLAYDLGFD